MKDVVGTLQSLRVEEVARVVAGVVVDTRVSGARPQSNGAAVQVVKGAQPKVFESEKHSMRYFTDTDRLICRPRIRKGYSDKCCSHGTGNTLGVGGSF